MTSIQSVKALKFRCPKELSGIVPPPIPAARGLPEWLRTMPAKGVSWTIAGEDDTVKRCPPFVDAMTSGFLIPLICDLRVENGEFFWENDLPGGASAPYPRSPISFHDPGQVVETPLFDADQFLIKFNNVWTIEAPEGYALLFTHPVNRFDLPFTTLTGMVDCDRFRDAWIHFPARWLDERFSGTLPRGTPVAQCFPVKRETWKAEIDVLNDDAASRAQALLVEMERDRGVYRRRFRI